MMNSENIVASVARRAILNIFPRQPRHQDTSEEPALDLHNSHYANYSSEMFPLKEPSEMGRTCNAKIEILLSLQYYIKAVCI